ncbi:MAG: hypothetical protein KJ601_02135 [Nanoarchaeota archaeon]|nr:hypothetical protein [Nanoarchaeota archaeon]MBU1704946.1 hypothetical protein [Nanoarchaeota archaeon]
MDKKQLIKAWERFAEKNDFMLNPDKKIVETIADGVLINEQKKGLKYCPCRLTTGDFVKDLELLCPCNFKTHTTWLEPKGRQKGCWCSLFVVRK